MELERVNIPIPLSKLSKNPSYKNKISKWIQNSSVDVEGDVISLQDEKPSVVFGPSSDMIDETVLPFYVTLKVHDFLLYNCMLDPISSHNLMPKVNMDQLIWKLLNLTMIYIPLIPRRYNVLEL